MAIKAVKLCGLKEKKYYNRIKKLKDVNGRLELVREFKIILKFLLIMHTHLMHY